MSPGAPVFPSFPGIPGGPRIDSLKKSFSLMTARISVALQEHLPPPPYNKKKKTIKFKLKQLDFDYKYLSKLIIIYLL